MPDATRPLDKWMTFILRFAAAFNLCAGSTMLVAPRITYAMIGMKPPELDFPMQLVGMLVALFGVGYYQVARRPFDNYTLLWLGMWSKTFGTLLSALYVLRGQLPLQFVPVFLLADAVYVIPFHVILRRIRTAVAQASSKIV